MNHITTFIRAVKDNATPRVIILTMFSIATVVLCIADSFFFGIVIFLTIILTLTYAIFAAIINDWKPWKHF